MDERNIKIAKVLRRLFWTFLIGAGVLVIAYLCLYLYISIPLPINSRIDRVEYSQQYGPLGRTYFPRPGYTLLLVGVYSSASDELSYGYEDADLALIDRQGNAFPLVSEYGGKYIFEVPVNADHLRLRLPGGSTLKVELPKK